MQRISGRRRLACLLAQLGLAYCPQVWPRRFVRAGFFRRFRGFVGGGLAVCLRAFFRFGRLFGGCGRVGLFGGTRRHVVHVMQHQQLTRAAHRRNRQADHAREGGVRLLVDAHDLGDRQPRRIHTVEPARDEFVARLNVGADRHEAQVERIALKRAVNDAAQAGAHDLHGHGLILVGQQRDFGLQREHAGHLTDHAVFVHDRRAVLNALLRATIDDDLLRERIARVVLDFSGQRLRGRALRQLQQCAQMAVLSGEFGGCIGLLRQLKVARAQLFVVAAQGGARHGQIGGAHEDVAWHQRCALQRIETHAEHAANDFERLEACVGDQQGERQHDEKTRVVRGRTGLA